MPANGSDGFTALGLDPRLLDALTGLGYEEPTPIQRETIPPLIERRDLLGQAATGTGKTAAFAEAVAGDVLEALRASSIKGRKVTVRRDRPRR